jgi:hypothetical protein
MSTGSFLQKREKEQEAKKIADQVARERKKESDLGGIMSLLSVPLGFATGGLSTALGLGSGLFGSIGTALIGGGLSSATEDIARGLGAGGDPSKIKSSNKYGFGRQEAEDYRSSMQEGIDERDSFNPESLLASTVMNYAGQFAPKFGKDIVSGDAIKGATKEGAKKGFGEKFKEFLWNPEEVGFFGSKVSGAEGFKAGLGGEEAISDALKHWDASQDVLGELSSEEINFAQGGLVPSDNKSQTIADYFSMQGKSLGGNNKKSLAEMLGRK